MLPLSSDSVDQFAAALAAAQAEFPRISKTKTARVPTRNGGEYTYKYADIADVIEAVRSILQKHGLSYTQLTGFLELPHPTNTELKRLQFGLYTMVLHSSGQWSKSFLPLPENVGPQDLGSSLTYMRRYGLTAALGIAAEEDDDGGLGQRGAKDRSQRKPEPGPGPAERGPAKAAAAATVPGGEPGAEVKGLTLTVERSYKLGTKGMAYECSTADGRKLKVLAWSNIRSRPSAGDVLTAAGKYNEKGELVVSAFSPATAPSAPRAAKADAPAAKATAPAGPPPNAPKATQAAPTAAKAATAQATRPQSPAAAKPGAKKTFSAAELAEHYKAIHAEAIRLGIEPKVSLEDFRGLSESEQLAAGKVLKEHVEYMRRQTGDAQ